MWRIRFLKFLLIIAVIIVGIRLFVIQIIEHSQWVEKAVAEHTLLETIMAERGQIYMMDVEEGPTAVAMNQKVYAVIIDPMVTDKEQIRQALEKHAKAEMTTDIDRIYKQEGLRYYIVARNVGKAVADEIAKEGILGVRFQQRTRRVYPEGEMASRLLGFVNEDGEGQYGVEGALNQRLKGEDGMLKTVADVNKVALSIGNDNIRKPAVNGENIVLTIDRGLERGVEDILAKVREKKVGAQVATIVMDPRNGQVLAMANLPNYNPAEYGRVKDATEYINYTTEIPYEPASICKTFTFATTIDKGVMKPETKYLNKGFLIVDGKKIENAYQGKIGEIDMQTALNYSLNTGSIQALKWLGGNETEITQEGRGELYNYFYNRFGFGVYTGIELYEALGVIPKPDEGYARDLTYATITFGQGLNMTMIQAVAAFASIVNGGEYYRPTIVAGTMKGQEFRVAENNPVVRRVIEPETSEIMRRMLYGTRLRRRELGIDRRGYYVGGKTGTAQVVREGAYTEAKGETIASYIGFGGRELPEYVIMVKIWEEGKHLEGERDALPIFDEISNFVQNYFKIKPKV